LSRKYQVKQLPYFSYLRVSHSHHLLSLNHMS